jgi:hypothetical protein
MNDIRSWRNLTEILKMPNVVLICDTTDGDDYNRWGGSLNISSFPDGFFYYYGDGDIFIPPPQFEKSLSAIVRRIKQFNTDYGVALEDWGWYEMEEIEILVSEEELKHILFSNQLQKDTRAIFTCKLNNAFTLKASLFYVDCGDYPSQYLYSLSFYRGDTLILDTDPLYTHDNVFDKFMQFSADYEPNFIVFKRMLKSD